MIIKELKYRTMCIDCNQQLGAWPCDSLETAASLGSEHLLKHKTHHVTIEQFWAMKFEH